MASDDAAREYLERTPKEDQTATGVWDAMTEASESMVETIKKKDFTKYLAIANPKNGDEFLEEVIATFMLSKHSTCRFRCRLFFTCLTSRFFAFLDKPPLQ